MIEINLLPGAEKRKRATAGGFNLKVPESLRKFDRMMVFIIAAWIIGPALGLWLYLGVQDDLTETGVALERAVADSARFADVIATQQQLQARQDTISQKLQIIQEIDAGRYVWPHIMDEVSRALPAYTWLEGLNQVSGGAVTRFEVEGRTGNLPALTRYMDALEASPFLRNIQLVNSERTELEGSASAAVNEFILVGTYELPSFDVVETVPLFEGAETNPSTPGEASDGTGTS